MVKILHFADAHIDIVTHGRHDPTTGLPVRVMDFLRSLDTIVACAIEEQVDLVLFAGDAYKDRNPAPTYQREWHKRIVRLSQAGIPTLLLVGNHDLSPALGRAHALNEFSTLQVPHVRVLDKPDFLSPPDLENLPLQIIALPWISRSGMMAHFEVRGQSTEEIYRQLEERLSAQMAYCLEQADPELPTVLTAHASVQGARYGGERMVMLGNDLVLPAALVKDPRLDYVALGHIHKAQNLNEEGHPPAIYPGSIERVDFGEANDDKFFVIAEVEKGHTRVEWRQLTGIRPFVDRFLRLESPDNVAEQLRSALPPASELKDAIVRLVLEYPREWEALIDEAAIHEHTAQAFEFHLVKRPQQETRIRLPQDQAIGALSPLELLELYWRANHFAEDEIQALSNLAAEIIQQQETGE
ncbi:MAG: exonuclease SbcCD subunit D [Anaerolineae bacterium]|nr:MAG: exonuclease SbcCD subunit D [Anaerolineae bacterium]